MILTGTFIVLRHIWKEKRVKISEISIQLTKLGKENRIKPKKVVGRK